VWSSDWIQLAKNKIYSLALVNDKEISVFIKGVEFLD